MKVNLDRRIPLRICRSVANNPNFSKKMNQDENADLRQSSMSSNNSLYNNPGFVRVTQKMEQGKYLPYNYSEKKVICPKSSNAERGVPTLLTTSQFSKLYRRELNSSTSVKKKKRQLMESKEYRRNFCSNYKNGKKPKKKASFQLEEYLGSRPLNQNAKNPKTMPDAVKACTAHAAAVSRFL